MSKMFLPHPKKNFLRKSSFLSKVPLLLSLFILLNCKPEKEEPKPESLPVVITGEVSSVTTTAASVTGQVTSDGNAEVTDRGLVLGSESDPTVSDTKISAGSGIGTFSADFSGLTRATTYHVRAYATNAKGTSYGLDKSFTTSAELPTVSTTEISGITAFSAIGGGNITDDGGSPVTARGVCWSTSQNPTIDADKTTDDISMGSFTSSMLNLLPATTYYVRAYAENIEGISYGAQLQFTTDNITPINSVVDIDGNTYGAVTIGNQIWMAENLKVSHYKNGDEIINITNNTAWSALITGAFSYYNNDQANNIVYGKLYNWYAATDLRGLCPTGWHVPSDVEWTILTDFLGGESIAGGKMKSTGTTYWQSPNLGATNESGFSGLPGGVRDFSGSFSRQSEFGSWWSTFDYDPLYSWPRGFSSSSELVQRGLSNKTYGFSIRCLKD